MNDVKTLQQRGASLEDVIWSRVNDSLSEVWLDLPDEYLKLMWVEDQPQLRILKRGSSDTRVEPFLTNVAIRAATEYRNIDVGPK